MAITTSFEQVEEQYNPHNWGSIDEFEKFFLREKAETLPDTNYYTGRNGKQRTIKPIDHYPELKEYEVWSEGYMATGQSGGALLMGKTKARNFAQACHIVLCKQRLEQAEKENDPNDNSYSNPHRWDYDPYRLSYWGCKLYWSEKLARKSFG